MNVSLGNKRALNNLMNTFENTDPLVKEALARSLGTYLFMRANFGSEVQKNSELDAEDITKIFTLWQQTMQIILASEVGAVTSIASRQSENSAISDVEEGISQLVQEGVNRGFHRPESRKDGV